MRNFLLEKGITYSGVLSPPYEIVVPLSGGKDSQACLKLALESYDPWLILALFCDTRFEHPSTYKHIRETAKIAHVDLIELNAGSVLSICTKYKRLPGGGSRHCTDELKIRPSKYFYGALALEQDKGFQVWCGMRAGESAAREKRYKDKISENLYAPNDVLKKYPKYLEKRGVYFKLPILEWSEEDVFDYLAGEENPLYAEGFDRVGCFPCLAGGEALQMKAFNYDLTGNKHFQIAQQIADLAGRPVLTSKKYFGQGPACAFCSI